MSVFAKNTMTIQIRPELSLLNILAPLVVAPIVMTACSFLREPGRRQFSAIMIAGAGAAYLNGGLLGWAFVFFVPFVPLSSAGCAICDTALALWYFQGAPSIFVWLRRASDR